MTSDEGPREYTVGYDSSTLETVRSYVCIGNDKVGNWTDGCICRSSEKDGCVEKQRSDPCHGCHCERKDSKVKVGVGMCCNEYPGHPLYQASDVGCTGGNMPTQVANTVTTV